MFDLSVYVSVLFSQREDGTFNFDIANVKNPMDGGKVGLFMLGILLSPSALSDRVIVWNLI